MKGYVFGGKCSGGILLLKRSGGEGAGREEE
jgi:hypothetical protein